MMNTILVLSTLVGMAEAYMLMFCGFRLVGFSISHRRLLLAAVAVALFIRASRLVLYNVLDAPLGTHIILALIAFFLVGYAWFRLPAILAAIAVVIGDMILSFGTLLVQLLLPTVAPGDFGTIVKLMALEETPLVLATAIIWKTKFAIVPKRVTQNLKG